LAWPLSAAPAEVDPFEGGGPSGKPVELGEVELEDWLDLPITSVSLTEERASQAPAAVFVLTGDDVRSFGFRTLAEVLRAVPGIFIVPDSAYLNVGVRGLSMPGDQVTRFLVMIDGRPVNNSVGIGQGYLERELPVAPQALERVEDIQGPIGGVYGPVAFMGAVNFVTKRSSGLEAEALVSGELGSRGVSGGELALTLTHRYQELEITAHLGGYRSRGTTYQLPELGLFSDRAVPPGALVRGADWMKAENAFLRLGLRGLSLSVGYSYRIRDLASAPYGAIVGDQKLYYANRSFLSSLGFEKRSELVSALVRVGFEMAEYQDNIGALEGNTERRYEDDSYDRWASGEARVTLTPVVGLRALLGANAQAHFTRQLYGYAGDAKSDVPLNFATASIYGLVEWRGLSDRLTLQAGANWYWSELASSRLTPRGAMVVRVTDSTTAKLFATGGFRTPTLFEGYYSDGISFVPNPGLKSDSSLSLEASIEQQLGRSSKIGLSFFDTSYDNLIMQQATVDELLDGSPGLSPADFTSSFGNLASFGVDGAQLYFDVRQPRVRLWGGVSVQAARDVSRLAGFANLTATLAISTNLPWKPLWLSLNGALISPRFKPNAAIVPGSSEEVPWGGTFGISARLTWPELPGFTVQVSLQNVLGSTLRHPLAIDYAPLTEFPEPELEGRLSLEWRSW
jgi:iron complex outermembrane receptor protein